MSCIVNNNFDKSESSPYLIREGFFGATFNKNEETLFLRMELLTKENEKNWTQYKTMSCWVANANSRGVLSNLLSLTGKDNYPNYDRIREVTGFTEKEYADFTEKAIALKNKTQKIAQIISANSVGIEHMTTHCHPESSNFIVYISKNRDFSIPDADKIEKERTLKNFIELYNDILISVGSDFSGKESFHNRGISRNPYWVYEEKYSGLSMILHGFTGAIAEKFFPEKKMMHVRPIGSMQTIIKNYLLPGEGYIGDDNEKVDITQLEVSPNDPEGKLNYIKVSALTRIYNQVISKESK
jgi:hypothetical protein